MRKYMHPLIMALISESNEMAPSARVTANGVFYSYNTPIAIWKKDVNTLYITMDKFSKTTSHQQNSLHDFFYQRCYIVQEVDAETIREMVKAL